MGPLIAKKESGVVRSIWKTRHPQDSLSYLAAVPIKLMSRQKIVIKVQNLTTNHNKGCQHEGRWKKT